MTPIKKGIYEFKRDSLIQIRKELGLSQNKMAELLCIPANTLSRWETGATIPDASSLASIYSLARELGLDTLSFFGIRDDLPSIEIRSPDTIQDSIQSLSFYQGLKGYLKTQIEDIGSISNPVIKVEISNTAPYDSGTPEVVFVGVGLSLASIGRDISSLLSQLKVRTKRIKRTEEIEAKITPWENDAKRKGLLNVSYQRPDNITFPDFTGNEHGQGLVLFQGDSVIYEIDVPSELLPYLKFRVEGNLSWRHLSRYEETFDMPEAFTKPLAISALKDFNSIDIHKSLVSVIESITEYNNDRQSFDINRFNTLLSESITEAQTMQDNIHNDFRQHTFRWFRAHLRAAHIYLDIVKGSLKRLEETIGLGGKTDKIEPLASMILSLKNTASQFNRETEGFMDMLNISDEEVGYRYREMG